MPSSSNAPLSTPALGSFLEGWRRAVHAPAIIGVMMGLTVITSLMLAVALNAQLAPTVDVGPSTGFPDRWDDEWTDGLNGASSSLLGTFSREILGFGGTIAIFDRIASGRWPSGAVLWATGFYLLAWVVLTGGVATRLARGRPIGAAAFWRACRASTLPLVRLGMAVGLAYACVFGLVGPLVLDGLLPRFTGPAASEPMTITWTATAYAIVFTTAALVTLVADYARVRLVVEGRRSALGAILASGRFLWRRRTRAVSLFLLNLLALAVVIRLWLQIAPTATTSTWLALLATEAYVVARIVAKLGWLASGIVFVQGELAHATYVAPPAPEWPAGVPIDEVRRGRPVSDREAQRAVR